MASDGSLIFDTKVDTKGIDKGLSEIQEKANGFTIGKGIMANLAADAIKAAAGMFDEERLDNNLFVRISNSEIVNLKKVKSLDLSFAGTICMELSNGDVSYVSRRYVSKIKKILGL